MIECYNYKPLIRELEENDADAFLKLLLALDGEAEYLLYEPGERKTNVGEILERIKKFKVQENSTILVAEENEEIIGFLSAEGGAAKKNRHSVYIVIGILQQHTGKKIGTKLFETLIDWAKKSQITKLELTVMIPNEHAVNLYKKMGFEIEGIKKCSMYMSGIYIDEYYMGKILTVI